MLTSTDCIALRTVKYNDRHNILTVYTRQRGRMSLLIGAGNSREANRRRAVTMPLSLINCIVDLRNDRDIPSIREIRVTRQLSGLHADPAKMAMGMFLSEILGIVLSEGDRDDILYTFLAESIAELSDIRRGAANFHLAFLYRLGYFLGIQPDTSGYREGRVFDLVDAVFRDAPPLHGRYLEASEAKALVMLSRMTFDNMHLYRYNREQRHRIMSVILDYYSLHYASLSSLNSLEVLRRLFD
ncbi:MAG: DNA repair protein RecO [Muribaculum sp.]|nr:DNA repair protein RecO [Muribaculum sp.]